MSKTSCQIRIVDSRFIKFPMRKGVKREGKKSLYKTCDVITEVSLAVKAKCLGISNPRLRRDRCLEPLAHVTALDPISLATTCGRGGEGRYIDTSISVELNFFINKCWIYNLFMRNISEQSTIIQKRYRNVH